jgi:hypothetical protein
MPDVDIRVLGTRNPGVTERRMHIAGNSVLDIRQAVLAAVNIARKSERLKLYASVDLIVGALHQPLDHRSENCTGLQIWVKTGSAHDATEVHSELMKLLFDGQESVFDAGHLELFGSIEVVVDTDRVVGSRLTYRDDAEPKREYWDDRDDIR